nr:phosphoadenosine phosphosulfate reductase family protein [Bacillus subtilis]
MIKQNYDDGKKHIHVLSYGGGTQSTTLLLMALKGEINGVIPDYIIFSDTGWEPQHVYNWVNKVNEHIKATYGREIIFTDNGNIRDDIVQGAETGNRFASIPFFTRDSKGEIGIARLQCTNEYKILPVNRRKSVHCSDTSRGSALKKSFTYGKALALMKFSELNRARKAGK